MQRQVPTTNETLEVPQDQFIDKVMDVPVVSQGRDRTVHTQSGDRGCTDHGRVSASGYETPTAEDVMQVTAVVKQAKGRAGDPELEPGARA